MKATIVDYVGAGTVSTYVIYGELFLVSGSVCAQAMNATNLLGGCSSSDTSTAGLLSWLINWMNGEGTSNSINKTDTNSGKTSNNNSFDPGNNGLKNSKIKDTISKLKTGKNSGTKVVSSKNELDTLFRQLTNGGKSTTWTNYNGQVYEMPDGTQIGLRNSSKSGGATLDIVMPDGYRTKVHIE